MKLNFWNTTKAFIVLWLTTSHCLAGENDGTSIWMPDIFRMNSHTDTHWGVETNYVKVGLLIQYLPDTNRTDDVGFFPVLYNSSTNNYEPGGVSWLQLWLPPLDWRYQMTLLDMAGKPVPKTEKGEMLGKPLETRPKKISKYNGYQGCALSPTDPPYVISESFLLRDYFNITKPGKYRLEFQLRALQEMGKLDARQFCPSVNVEIEIKNP